MSILNQQIHILQEVLAYLVGSHQLSLTILIGTRPLDLSMLYTASTFEGFDEPCACRVQSLQEDARLR